MIKTDKGHFWLTFKNGYTISIFNGFGSHSENHFNCELQAIPEYYPIASEDCELAIIHNGGFVTKDILETTDSVMGYVTADELANIIKTVSELPEGGNNE